MGTTIDIPQYIKKQRGRLSLEHRTFGVLLGLNGEPDQKIVSWETGDKSPSESQLQRIRSLNNEIPFRDNKKKHKFSFIDLFAGIGGIRLPFQELGGECVFSSEWDKFAQQTYIANFGECPHGDILATPSDEIPDHDILLGGFPCQAFSQAGLKKGFHDTRGTLFFEIQRILAHKQPKAFLLENVKQLRGHNKGRTLDTILSILQGNTSDIGIPKGTKLTPDVQEALETKLNYDVDCRVLRAGDFGLPQNRERIYIVGFNKTSFSSENPLNTFEWPEGAKTTTKVGDILEDSKSLDPKYTLSKKLWAGHQRRLKEHRRRGNGFGYSLFNKDSIYTSTLSARYYKDGSEILIDQSQLSKRPRKLTPKECSLLQGFPKEFVVNAVSDVQAYKQFGNSVAVPVVRAVARNMLSAIQCLPSRKG